MYRVSDIFMSKMNEVQSIFSDKLASVGLSKGPEAMPFSHVLNNELDKDKAIDSNNSLGDINLSGDSLELIRGRINNQLIDNALGIDRTLGPARPQTSKNISTNKASPNEGLEFLPFIEEASQVYNISPSLIRGLIRVESFFNPENVSSAGALGLMQLMPGTAKYMGVENSFDPYQNIMGGSRYLREQIDKFGDIRLALAAYNAGPNKVLSWNIEDPDLAEEYGKISSGVRAYIERVLEYARDYEEGRRE